MERTDTPLKSSSSGTDTKSRSKPKGLERLEALLEYELRGSVRYRRFATVVLVGSPGDDLDVLSLLSDHIRSSDEIFDISPNAAILMGETDSVGAMAAIYRFKSFCKSECDLRYSVASFPADARGMAELLWIAYRRLEEAKEREPGAVVGSV